MPKFEIRNRWTSALIFKWEGASLKLAVEAAVEQRVSLRAADLRAADLRDADLRAADLRAADLRAANLTSIRDDLWAVLSASPAEVPALRKAIAEGRINGSTYEGDCACLVGTLANARGCFYSEIQNLRPDSYRPAEVWFVSIKLGDTPKTNPFAAKALEWCDQWLANMQSAFGAAVTA